MVPDGAGHDVCRRPLRYRRNPIKDANGEQFYSDCPDGTSLLSLDNPTVSGVTGNAVFCVVQFEYTSRNAAGDSMYGKLPSPVAVLTLDQDREDWPAQLVGKYHNVDTGGVNGLWITCGASLSPWGTPVERRIWPDATTAATDPQFLAYSRNLHANASAVANPYHYGHMPEVTVNPDGTGSIRKHYCMGRISHELVQVMPMSAPCSWVTTPPTRACSCSSPMPRRISPRECSTSPDGPRPRPPADPAAEPARLGQASVPPRDEHRDQDPGRRARRWRHRRRTDGRSGRCEPYEDRFRWQKQLGEVRRGSGKGCGLLETHRYAAFKGGSLAFTKMEGVTVNVADRKAFLAMSRIDKTMTDGSTDVPRGQDHRRRGL